VQLRRLPGAGALKEVLEFADPDEPAAFLERLFSLEDPRD
jgi:hypothetical protein